MTPQPASRRQPPLSQLLLVLSLLTVCGCAGLPRIDPTGESLLIFPDELPPPVPAAAGIDPFTGANIIAPPAGNITAPPVMSDPVLPGVGAGQIVQGGLLGTPTIVGPAVGPAVVGQPVPQDRLLLSPQRVLAPVGSEVILKAAICKADGYTVSNRRIEWMLDQSGTGQFVTLGDRGQHDILRWPWEKPKKVDNYYAVGYTTPYHNCLRRNLADPADDVQIRPGDAWVSVTSAAEGTSYVTAYAPGVDDWATRKAKTVIYWVDAQWALPPSVTIEAGQPHTLTTTVTRQSDGAPLEGWIVRYDVADQSGALLGYDAGQTAEATTNSRGQASIEIRPTDSRPGTSNVQITITRPEQAGVAASPRLDVGQGQTSITWAVDGGPAPVLPPVDLEPAPPIQDPVVTPPPIDTRPPVQPAPTGRPDLEVRMRQESQGPFKVGDTVAYSVVVRNNGDGPARNILIIDEFDPGLSNQYDTEGRNKVEYPAMSDLEAGESDQVRLEFQILQPGRLCHNVTVRADGATEAFDNQCIEAESLAPEAAQLRVNLGDATPIRPTVGQPVTFEGVVENTDTIAATNIVVTVKHDPQLRLNLRPETSADERFELLSDGYQITLPRLEPGQRRQLKTQYLASRETPLGQDARVTMFVRADGGYEGANDSTVEILPSSSTSPADGAPGPGPTGGTGPLSLSVVSQVNPAQVGNPSVINMYLENTGTAPQREVRVQLSLPPRITPRTNAIQAPVQFRTVGQGIIEFAPIAELLPGQRLPVSFLIPYEATGPGRVRIQARVSSAESPAWVSAEQLLEINPR